jgi:hypothetical protein
MSATKRTIESIRDGVPKPTDADVLAQMFETTLISDDGTVAGRLRDVLDATESSLVPGLQTGIKFHDTGFRSEFKDPWPSSDNQVGHFLTAVGLSFNPSKVAQSFMARRLRDWLGADSTLTDEEVAIRLTVGHEKAPDPGAGTAAGGAIPGWIAGGPIGAGAGAAIAILEAFRTQYSKATPTDVTNFRSAETNLGPGTKLDLKSADTTLHGITVDKSMQGNSYEDLLLSCCGWRLGQWIKSGKFTATADVGTWIRTNLM